MAYVWTDGSEYTNTFPVVDDHSRVILQPMEDDPTSDYINANYIDVSGDASSIGERVRNISPSLVCEAFYACPLSTIWIQLFFFSPPCSKCLYSLTFVVLSFTLPMILWAVDMAVQGCKYHCRGSPAPTSPPKQSCPLLPPVPLHL